jgi:hypothetical protein
MQDGRQRREKYRQLVAARALFVVVAYRMSCCSVKGAGPEGEAGSVPWVKPMGTVMAGKPVWGETWESSPAGLVCVADLAGRVAPGGVDDRVEVIALHRLGERVAESDLGRVVIDVGRGAAAVECGVRIGLGRHDRTVDVVADVRKVEAGVHDGLERVIGALGCWSR